MNTDKRVTADRRDRIFALIYLLLGYGFIYTFSAGYFGRNLALFTVCYVAAVLAYNLGKGKKLTVESVFWACAVIGIGVPGAFWSIMPGLQVLALIVAAAYWTLTTSGRLLEEGKTSRWIFFDLWNAGIFVPFSNFGCQLRVLLGGEREGTGTEEIKGAVPEEKAGAGGGTRRMRYAAGIGCGLILAIPLLMIVLPLLSSADARFEAALGGLGIYLSEHFLATLIRILFSLPVSAYLFGLVYGSIRGRYTDRIDREKVRAAGEKARMLPDTAFYTALGILCLVYVLFIWLQAEYLFSAFAGIRPEGFTYAEYARQGFFELCVISFFNLFFLLCASLFSEHRMEENKGLRILNVVLSVLTLLLIATAMSKLVMYIGLTVNRILPQTFMIWMTVVYAAMILRQRKVFPMAKICIMTGAVLFVLLCVVPVEDCVQAYNIWARNLGLIR